MTDTTTVEEAMGGDDFECPYCGEIKSLNRVLQPDSLDSITIHLDCGEEIRYKRHSGVDGDGIVGYDSEISESG